MISVYRVSNTNSNRFGFVLLNKPQEDVSKLLV